MNHEHVSLYHMFRQTYQSGLLSILSSIGAKPLGTWKCKVSNGYIKRITDEDTNSLVLELISSNVSSTYLTCPYCPHELLGIKMAYLNMYIKNLRRYFVMEIEVLDSKNMHRRFKISSFASKTKIGPFGTHSPLNWIEGWNRLSLNLESFTKTVYGTNYVECRRITIHANCRIRRIFFADREYKEEELPLDYQIRCRIDRMKRYVPTRRLVQERMFASKKPLYQTKNEQDETTKLIKPPATSITSPQPLVSTMDTAKEQVQNQFANIEAMPSEETGINAPQGSVASDVQQVEYLSDNDGPSDTEFLQQPGPTDDQQKDQNNADSPGADLALMNNQDLPSTHAISNDLSNLDGNPIDPMNENISGNAYRQARQRYLRAFHQHF